MPAPRGGCRAGKEAGLGSASTTELSGLEIPPALLPPHLGSLESAATSPGNSPLPSRRQGKEVGEARTATEVAEDVVALLREGDLVDSVADEAGLQQVAGVFAGLSPVSEAFHVVVQPVHHIRA